MKDEPPQGASNALHSLQCECFKQKSIKARRNIKSYKDALVALANNDIDLKCPACRMYLEIYPEHNSKQLSI